MEDLGFTLRVARSDTGTLHVRVYGINDDVETSVAVKACNEIQRCLDDCKTWLDKPTVPGLYVVMAPEFNIHYSIHIEPGDVYPSKHRCYGPIPEDTER